MNHLDWISSSRVYSDEENCVLLDGLSTPPPPLKLASDLMCEEPFIDKLSVCLQELSHLSPEVSHSLHPLQ